MKEKHKKVWVNGTFDVLHLGHIRLLKHAAELGELYVGIDTDRRVKELKGPDRPIHNQDERKEMLESFHFVSKVLIFDTSEELREIVKAVEPDYLVVGAEYKDRVVGGEHAKEIVYFQRIPNYSTTKILKGK
jgi:D-beta-D-heptose 7-phosphate kinase/D-beta-D-heptose 1-phosphate adenosyltransferase